MKKVYSYYERQVGDILLVSESTAELSKLIQDAERELDPGMDWYPSHVAIIGPDRDHVVEAIIDKTHNSVAAVNPVAKYNVPTVRLEVWRPEGTTIEIAFALAEYLAEYAPKPYGLLDLVGFLGEAALRYIGFKHAQNIIEVSYVCSEGGLIFLRKVNARQTSAIATGPLGWTTTDEAVRNVAPSTLRKLFIRHS